MGSVKPARPCDLVSTDSSLCPRHGTPSMDSSEDPRLCHYVCHHNSYYICTPIGRPFLKFDIHEKISEKGEDAISHLNNYERVCEMQNPEGIDGDKFKLEFFDFSLRGKAKKWFRSLPNNSKDSWTSCKNAFMLEFYYHEIDFNNCNLK